MKEFSSAFSRSVHSAWRARKRKVAKREPPPHEEVQWDWHFQAGEMGARERQVWRGREVYGAAAPEHSCALAQITWGVGNVLDDGV